MKRTREEILGEMKRTKEGSNYNRLLKQKRRLRLQVESLKTQLSKKESKLIEVYERIRKIELSCSTKGETIA